MTAMMHQHSNKSSLNATTQSLADMQDAEIRLAKMNGSYDEHGIIKPQGESIAFKKKQVGAVPDPIPLLPYTPRMCFARYLVYGPL